MAANPKFIPGCSLAGFYIIRGFRAVLVSGTCRYL